MADIKKIFGNRYTSSYPQPEEVTRVGSVDEYAYAMFVIILAPDSYSLNSMIYHETKNLFRKASSDVVNKIVRKYIVDSGLWKQAALGEGAGSKIFEKYLLSDKGRETYPDLITLEKESLEYWLNEYVNGELMNAKWVKPEFQQYLRRELKGLKEKYLKGNLIEGRKIEVIMPNGEKRKGQFVVVELDNILASHNEDNFEDTQGYPTDASGYNINDRNYKGDQNAQNAVIMYAQNLEPERLITTSRTPSGTPIITTDGFVVSGNNRVMSMKRTAKYHPEKWNAYVDFLKEEWDAFGLGSVYELEGFKKPVLVRIDFDFPEYNTAELAKYNKDTKKSERPIDAIVKLSNILRGSPKCTEIIANTIGEFENMSEFKRNFNAQKKVFDNLRVCNIVTEQERAKYFDEHGFNEQGMYLVEMLLSAIVLDRDALIVAEKEGVKSFRNAIVTSLPTLMKNSTLGLASLIKEINQAVILQYKIVASGLTFPHYVSQTNIVDEPPDMRTMFLNRLMDSGRNIFRQAIDKYNESVSETQGESLFGEKPSLEEIFKTHIEKKVEEKNPDDAKVIYQLFGKKTAPEKPEEPKMEVTEYPASAEQAVELTPSDLDWIWQGKQAKFQKEVEQPQKELIEKYEKELAEIKGRGTEKKVMRERLSNLMEEAEAKIIEGRDKIGKKNFEFQELVAGWAVQEAKRMGLDFGDYAKRSWEQIQQTSEDWSNFLDNLIVQFYERPYIESNWNTKLKDIIQAHINDYLKAEQIEKDGEQMQAAQEKKAKEEKERKLKLAKARAKAQAQKISILKLKTKEPELAAA